MRMSLNGFMVTQKIIYFCSFRARILDSQKCDWLQLQRIGASEFPCDESKCNRLSCDEISVFEQIIPVFFLSPVCAFLFFLQLQSNYTTFTHTFYPICFFFILPQFVVWILFFSSILYSFSFSFTVHLHRTDHLS